MLLSSANLFIAPHWLPNQVKASPRDSGHSLPFPTLNPRESDSGIRESLFLLLPAFLPLCLGLHIPSSGTTLPDTTTPPSMGITPASEMVFSKASEMGFFVKYFSEFRGITGSAPKAYLLSNARLPVLWLIVPASYLLRCWELAEDANGTWDLGYIISYRRGPSAHLGTQAKRGACHLCTLWFFTMPATCTFSSVLALLSTEAALASLTGPHIWHFTMRPKPKKYHKETTGQYF